MPASLQAGPRGDRGDGSGSDGDSGAGSGAAGGLFNFGLLGRQRDDLVTLAYAMLTGVVVAGSVFAFDVSIQYIHDLPDIFAVRAAWGLDYHKRGAGEEEEGCQWV